MQVDLRMNHTFARTSLSARQVSRKGNPSLPQSLRYRFRPSIPFDLREERDNRSLSDKKHVCVDHERRPFLGPCTRRRNRLEWHLQTFNLTFLTIRSVLAPATGITITHHPACQHCCLLLKTFQLDPQQFRFRKGVAMPRSTMAEVYKKVFLRFYPLSENISCRNCAAFHEDRKGTNVLPIFERNEMREAE